MPGIKKLMCMCVFMALAVPITASGQVAPPIPISEFYGAYNPVTTYYTGSIVSYGGSLYISRLSSNFNNVPGTAGSIWWSLFSSVTGGGLSTPPLTNLTYLMGVSSGSVAFSGIWSVYNSNAPTIGSVNPATSGLGYLSFAAIPSSPQYAFTVLDMPPYWTTLGMYFDFYTPTATTGNSVMDVQTACVVANQVVGSPTYSTAIVTTTAVSSTPGGFVRTAFIPNIAAPGLNGCPALGMTAPTSVQVQFFADATSAVETRGLRTVFVIGRSQ